MSTFGLWVDHFERNDLVHAKTDAVIDFDGRCEISGTVRRPSEYHCAAQLFVTEEQQHAALLLRLLGIRAAAQADGAADRLMVLTVAGWSRCPTTAGWRPPVRTPWCVRWPPALSPTAHDFIRDVPADFAKVVATVQRC